LNLSVLGCVIKLNLWASILLCGVTWAQIPPASRIGVDASAPKSFQDAINAALERLRNACTDCYGDHRAKQIMDYLDKHGSTFIFMGVDDNASATYNATEACLGGKGASKVLIWIDPVITVNLSDTSLSCNQSDYDSVLIHELTHAYLAYLGKVNCKLWDKSKSTDLKLSEIAATAIENNFRRCARMCTRTYYARDFPIPAGTDPSVPGGKNTGDCYCCACANYDSHHQCVDPPGCAYDSQTTDCNACPCGEPGHVSPGMCNFSFSRKPCS
jgi:hypothetical protein